MIRFTKISPLAMIAGLACPAFGQDQGAQRAEPPTNTEASIEVTEGLPTPTETSPIQEDVIGGEDENGTKAATIRRVYRTLPTQFDFTIHTETLEAKYGLSLAPIDETLRSQLDIPKGEGVVVLEVKAKSLAEQAGLKARDILLSVGDKPIKGVPAAQALLLGVGKEAVSIELIREGKPRQMSLVGPEHGFAAESAEFWIGVPVSPVDPILRSHLSELPDETGLIANDVVKDSPADRAGLKKNDILISMGAQPLKSSEDLIAQVQASDGKPLVLVVLRAGKPRTMEVTPTKRTHPTVVNFRATPANLRYQLFQPNVAIETAQPKPSETRIIRRGPGGLLEERVFGSQDLRYFAPATRTDKIIVNPHRVEGEPLVESIRSRADQRPIDIQLELLTSKARANAEASNARIEAQLKELSAKVGDLQKAIEGLKKPEEK